MGIVEPPSLNTITTALSFIPADLVRDEWARIGMALKSELDDSGFEIFDNWSKQGESYKADSVRETWKSIKASGQVKIGTLFHMAKEHGWKPEKKPKLPTLEELQQRKAETKKRKEHDTATERTKQAKHERVKHESIRRWDAAKPALDTHPYLTKKHLKASGLRFTGDALLVPMHDPQSGDIWNLQSIYPDKRSIRNSAEPRDKDFLPGGKKQGLCCPIGTPEDGKPLVVAEGWATAASIFEATGLPVLVAFDVGNIKHIGAAARKRYPEASIVFAADNDQWTKGNPGVREATNTAKAVGGVVAIPRFPDALLAEIPKGKKGPTDFADLLLISDTDAIEKTIRVALSKLTLRLPRGFNLNKDGISFEDPDGRDGPAWVCSPLKVSAVTRSDVNQDWGRLLEFSDMDGIVHQWAMPMQMLAGDGNEYRRTLLDSGVRISPSNRAKNLLTQYIQTSDPADRVRCVSKSGWHNRLYVLPDEVIGKHDGEKVILQTASGQSPSHEQQGTLNNWKDSVARYCAGNSRLAFAVSAAFAPVLLKPLNLESGGIHFRGNSSIGKSTTLYVAASVWGGPGHVSTWRSTDNGLEGKAQAHNDGLLLLDELKELDPKDAGKVVYMLANGCGKQRAGRNGEQRPPATWRILFVSTGELSIPDHIRDGGGRVYAGQEARIADIPADPEAGLGIFETLHDMPTGVHFSQYLMKASRDSHGLPSREFIRRVAADYDGVTLDVQQMRKRFAAEFVPDNADGQVSRVADRFAVIAAAGELATEWDITGWEPGEATNAAHTCFRDWLNRRGGVGKKETTEVIRQVREFLQLNGDARFPPLSEKSHSGYKYGNRAGYRASEVQGSTFYVLTEVFKREVCKGFDARFAANALLDAGFLERDKDRLTRKLPKESPDDGIRHRVYVIRGDILEAE